jgi:uncharacterized protein
VEGSVVQLWRYPVKSLQGERLTRAEVGPHGLVGDRAWGIVDEATGFVLTARREPGLLFASARLLDDGAVAVALPDGTVARDDGDLCEWLGRRVSLRRAGPDGRGTYETPVSFDHEDSAEWVTWQGPSGTFHDSTRTMVSIVSLGALGPWDIRRFRPNVVVTGDGEERLVGATVRIGGAELDVRKRVDRCVVVCRAQPGGVERDLDVLRVINRTTATFLGVGATVAASGRIAVGDILVAA